MVVFLGASQSGPHDEIGCGKTWATRDAQYESSLSVIVGVGCRIDLALKWHILLIGLMSKKDSSVKLNISDRSEISPMQVMRCTRMAVVQSL
jgi:hypothetical protein